MIALGKLFKFEVITLTATGKQHGSGELLSGAVAQSSPSSVIALTKRRPRA